MVERMRQPKRKGEKQKPLRKIIKFHLHSSERGKMGFLFPHHDSALYTTSLRIFFFHCYTSHSAQCCLMRTPDGIQFVNQEAEIFISAVRKRKRKTGKNSADYTNDGQWLMYVFTQGTEKRWKFLRVRISSLMNY